MRIVKREPKEAENGIVQAFYVIKAALDWILKEY